MVGIGEGWVEGSPLDVLLVSLPYLWGPKLEHCQLSDRHIQVLWLIPISAAERAYALANGVDALEQRFGDMSFEYLDPFRPSVVPEVTTPATPPGTAIGHEQTLDRQ